MPQFIITLWSYASGPFTHSNLLRWVRNPATLVTIGAPIVIDTCLWNFLAVSTGSYANLARSPDVCALLEHRTQLYTMLVASAFCIFQALLWSLFGAGQEDNNSKPRSPWRTTVVIFLSCALLWAVFSGTLMSENVVALYKVGACEHGVPSPMDIPPLSSPITWLRIFIAVLVLFASAPNGKHARAT
jgi:hypothetical protein